MKRKSTPKTITGCQTCRTRRIKCDEARPSCVRCLRSGWTCPGYTTTSYSDSSTTQRFYSLPTNIPGSASTRQALHHFATAAAPAIGGYFSADFWTRRILQSCVHDAPVRHAVAALAGVHREFVSCPVEVCFVASPAVAEAYGRAMKALRRYLRGGSWEVNVEVVMMCCAALFCFELVRGEQGAAGRHLSCGMSVLRQSLLGGDGRCSRAGRVREKGDQSQLVEVFARMDLQASAFKNGNFFTAQRASPDAGSEIDKKRDAAMLRPESNLDMHDYSMLLQRCFDFLVRRSERRRAGVAEVSSDLKRARSGLIAELNEWNKHLDAMSAEKGLKSLSAQLKSAFARSRLHSRILRILISQSPPPALPSPDLPPTLDDRADELLQLATDAIGVPNGGAETTSGRSKRQFCLHLGIVAPLFLLALKTSRADVLASCLTLLKRCKGRREGWYDADLVTDVVEELRRRVAEPVGQASLLERMGDDAATHVQSAVGSVIPAKNEASAKGRGLSRLLAIAG